MQFSIYRVWLLSKKQWAENRQFYLFGLLATAGVMSAAFLANVLSPDGMNYNMQQTILLGGAMIGGGLFTSTILSKINDKTKGIEALTLPASAAEKLVSAILYTLIAFPIAYLLVAYPVLVLVHYIDRFVVGHIVQLYDLKFANGVGSSAVALFILIQAGVMLCSLLFKRYALVKTIVTIFLVFYLTNGINPLFFSKALPANGEKYHNVNFRQIVYNEAGTVTKDTLTHGNIIDPELQAVLPFADITMYNKTMDYRINFTLDKPHIITLVLAVSKTAKFVFGLLFLLATPFLWLITWFRLRETQL